MESQMLLENLDEKFENKATTISAKWLSINFDQPIGDCQRILNDYLRTRNHFSAVYLLSGLDPNGNVVVKMVPQSKLDEVAKEFQKPPMKIIYSIHRNFDIKSSELIRSNVEQVLPLEKLKRLTTIPWEPRVIPRGPSLSETKNTRQVSQGPEFAQSLETIPKPSSPETKNHRETKNTRDFFMALSKNKNNTVATSSSNPAHKRPSYLEAQTENQQFLKQLETKGVSDDDNDEFLTSASIAEFVIDSCNRCPLVGNAKRKRLIVESDDEMNSCSAITCNSEDPPGSGKKKSASQGKQTKSSEPSGNREVLVENSETDSSAASHRYKSQSGRNNEPAVSRKAHKSKLTPQKSHAIGKSSPKIENSAGEPNRTRRPVMKTFQDDEGFMVTEKAWESASEEDEVEGEHVQPKQHPSAVSANVKNPSGKFDSSVLAGNAQLTANPTVGTVKTKEPVSRKKRSALSKPASKQASLSSFFKRA